MLACPSTWAALSHKPGTGATGAQTGRRLHADFCHLRGSEWPPALHAGTQVTKGQTGSPSHPQYALPVR